MPGCKVFVCQVLVYLKLDISTYVLLYLATHYHIMAGEKFGKCALFKHLAKKFCKLLHRSASRLLIISTNLVV